jgi:hypothetical protein
LHLDVNTILTVSVYLHGQIFPMKIRDGRVSTNKRMIFMALIPL